jgi:hypothetical protein
MFGIEDPGIWFAYLFGFGCLIFSICYGFVNWKKGSENDDNNEDKS